MKKTGKQVCAVLSVIFVLSAGVFAFRRMHTLASFAGLSATQQMRLFGSIAAMQWLDLTIIGRGAIQS